MDPFILFKYLGAVWRLWARYVPRKWLIRGLAASSFLTVILIVRDSV